MARILLVESELYPDISAALLRGAMEVVSVINPEKLEQFQVPGALEIPGAIFRARSRFDAFVALGCVIRGETSHYEIVATESARGLLNLTLQGICAGNGILTVDTREQAQARAGARGRDAVRAALSLLEATRRFQ